MLTVIQAPIGWSFLAWGALVPFALACTPQMRPRTLALLAFGVGYLYWLVNVYWIMPITMIGWLGMGLYLSVFWVLPALAVRFCRAKGISAVSRPADPGGRVGAAARLPDGRVLLAVPRPQPVCRTSR